MAPPSAAPQQYKQPSRKGKKAWRKNVDITEVHDGLDTARDEVIKTGGIIAEKPSADLFVLDTIGSDSIQRKHLKNRKPLKADEIIGQRSKIPAVDSRKRPAPGTTNGIVPVSSKKLKRDYVSHKELQRLKSRAYGGEGQEKDIIETGQEVTDDPWAEKVVVEDRRFTFLPKKQQPVAPKTLKDGPISLLENGKALPAIVKPKPGTSYNPDFDDYSNLLNEEGDKELAAERKRLQDLKDEEIKQAKIEAAQLEAERSEYYTEDESVWEGIESGIEGAELKKKRPQRKTPAERNKIKRRKAAEREARHQARMLERLNRGLPSQQASAGKGETESADVVPVEAEDSSDEDIDDRKLRRRKLGTIAVPEKPLEVVLPDELQDSLRMLKPEGNLLKDRFRNYLVAGKVETRRPGFQAKKAKKKSSEKWTYKDFQIPA